MINIKELLTPNSVLNKKEHNKPYVLLLKDFKSYDDILKYRHMIRDLELVPIKSDEMYQKYHSIDTQKLLESIDFTDSPILFKENELIWIQKGTPEKMILKFVQSKIDKYGDDVILFERPLNIKTELVKGSFPHIRHIHFWFKKI